MWTYESAPMNIPDINIEVMRMLQKKPVARTAFQRIHVGVLNESCQTLNLVVTCSGKRRPNESIKCDYEKALVNYVITDLCDCLLN